MVDGLIRFIMETRRGEYIDQFHKLIKLLTTLTEFTHNTLLILALFNYISLDDMKLMTTDENILDIYSNAGRDINSVIRNSSFSEVKKRIKIDTVIKKQTVMLLLFLDIKRQTITEYILNFENVEVDLECLMVANQLGTAHSIMKVLTSHYLKQIKTTP
jgi:hypothetical protein